MFENLYKQCRHLTFNKSFGDVMIALADNSITMCGFSLQSALVMISSLAKQFQKITFKLQFLKVYQSPIEGHSWLHYYIKYANSHTRLAIIIDNNKYCPFIKIYEQMFHELRTYVTLIFRNLVSSHIAYLTLYVSTVVAYMHHNIIRLKDS